MSATEEERTYAVGRINLLLEEYRALRSDLAQQSAAHATLIGFLAAAAALLTDRGGFTSGEWLVVVAGVLVIGLLYWLLSLPIRRDMARRVAEIEQALNLLADTAYGNLPSGTENAELQWETWRQTKKWYKRRPKPSKTGKSTGQ